MALAAGGATPGAAVEKEVHPHRRRRRSRRRAHPHRRRCPNRRHRRRWCHHTRRHARPRNEADPPSVPPAHSRAASAATPDLPRAPTSSLPTCLWVAPPPITAATTAPIPATAIASPTLSSIGAVAASSTAADSVMSRGGHDPGVKPDREGAVKEIEKPSVRGK